MTRRRNKSIQKKLPTRIITGPCRSASMYCTHLQTEESDKPGGSYEKSSPRILIKKTDLKTLKAIKGAIKSAAQSMFGSNVNIKSRKFGYPLRDGDEERRDPDFKGGREYKGCMFMNTKCFGSLPKLVDPGGVAVIDTEERIEMLVSGYYFRFSLTLKPYDKEGNKGVRANLNSLMFIKKGERLDGDIDPEEEFAEYADSAYDGDDDGGDD